MSPWLEKGYAWADFLFCLAPISVYVHWSVFFFSICTTYARFRRVLPVSHFHILSNCVLSFAVPLFSWYMYVCMYVRMYVCIHKPIFVWQNYWNSKTLLVGSCSVKMFTSHTITIHVFPVLTVGVSHFYFFLSIKISSSICVPFADETYTHMTSHYAGFINLK